MVCCVSESDVIDNGDRGFSMQNFSRLGSCCCWDVKMSSYGFREVGSNYVLLKESFVSSIGYLGVVEGEMGPILVFKLI